MSQQWNCQCGEEGNVSIQCRRCSQFEPNIGALLDSLDTPAAPPRTGMEPMLAQARALGEAREEIARLRQENEALRASAARTEGALREMCFAIADGAKKSESPLSRAALASVRESAKDLGLWRDAAREQP